MYAKRKKNKNIKWNRLLLRTWNTILANHQTIRMPFYCNHLTLTKASIVMNKSKTADLHPDIPRPIIDNEIRISSFFKWWWWGNFPSSVDRLYTREERKLDTKKNVSNHRQIWVFWNFSRSLRGEARGL